MSLVDAAILSQSLPEATGGESIVGSPQNRQARHLAAGEITLSQMLHEWALHDLGHIRQIAELVRARK